MMLTQDTFARYLPTSLTCLSDIVSSAGSKITIDADRNKALANYSSYRALDWTVMALYEKISRRKDDSDSTADLQAVYYMLLCLSYASKYHDGCWQKHDGYKKNIRTLSDFLQQDQNALQRSLPTALSFTARPSPENKSREEELQKEYSPYPIYYDLMQSRSVFGWILRNLSFHTLRVTGSLLANQIRLLVVRLNRFFVNLAAVFPVLTPVAQFSMGVCTVLFAPILAFVFYLPRFLTTSFLMLKRIIPGSWMSAEEKALGWSVRAKRAWSKYGYQWANDGVWFGINLVCFLFPHVMLAKTAALTLSAFLTTALYSFDQGNILVDMWSAWSAKKQVQKDYASYSNKVWEEKKLGLAINTAFCVLMCLILVPFPPLQMAAAGLIVAIAAFQFGYTIYKKYCAKSASLQGALDTLKSASASKKNVASSQKDLHEEPVNQKQNVLKLQIKDEVDKCRPRSNSFSGCGTQSTAASKKTKRASFLCCSKEHFFCDSQANLQKLVLQKV